MSRQEFSTDSQNSAVDLAHTLQSLNRGTVEIVFRPPSTYIVRLITLDGGQAQPASGQPQPIPTQPPPPQGVSAEVSWGKLVSPDFKARVVSIGQYIGCDPNHLMACIAFESGETFSPSIVNKVSGATGLIQFMPNTARALGTTTDALAEMSAVQQLDYVEKYFRPFKGKLFALSDVYAAILWPASVGQPDSTVLFVEGSKEYAENRGLDTNHDGQITKAETASLVQAKLEKGMSVIRRG
jgi:hypothetical protein